MWPNYSTQCRKEVNALLKRGGSLSAYRANPQVGVGPRMMSQAWRLEREIEKRFGVRHAVAVNSGTAGLHAGLVGLGVEGREVITSPFTFSATASAILLAGARPVFADIDPHTFTITKETVAKHVTKKTAAIIPVHLFGYFQDISGLQTFGLPVIEDACQAVGASRSGVFCGTQGLAGAMSFNGSKNIPSGEGGALVTNDDKIAEKARRFINHAENFQVDEIGVNYRMHEVVALVARHGLKELESRNQRRRELARVLIEESPNLGMWNPLYRELAWSEMEYPHLRGFDGWDWKSNHAFYCFPFLIKKMPRSRFIARCAKRGLPVGAGYITPILSDYPAFRRFKTAPLPVAEELSKKTLCILSTLSPDKPLSYARKVAKIIREALE